MISVGMVLFARLTQLDLTGPYEVLARLPDTKIHLVAGGLAPVVSDSGLTLHPNAIFADAPLVDVLFIPGGSGINAVLNDDAYVAFVRRQGAQARFVTAVCTGALLLGAAGLLRGYRATTHWLSLDLLPLVGAEPVAERVVIDRNRVTGAGVTAGIDFGLTLAALLHGEAVAKEIQLMLEYNPAPPFDSGSPHTADPAAVRALTTARQSIQDERRRLLTALTASPGWSAPSVAETGGPVR